MMIVDLSCLVPAALLLLRIIVAIVFFSSGKSHAMNPVERGESVGLSPAATRILGIAEILAAGSIALGIFPQIGAAIVMLTMLGAMQKKIFVWNTKFYEDKGYGWHYDLIFFLAAFVILATNGGSYIVL
ncbi:DoxX family protein [Frigoriflavimonas asaccharolytica]|uniref:Putative oxidoreductase n=1 Tax=Frigoriflavimonas asaccharolytica TaxID=2735899 RepID=A0A8J8K9T1_9FLAO|nr:DoxX family protein [Frigoriflavimonas asaccharolytica]NRS93991.1 putative oxidoreductase [Frigoriflavimonas asaccharolytica]